MVVVNTTNNTWARVGHQTDRAASPMVTLVTAEACNLCEDAHTELLNRATQGQLLLDQVDAESPQGQKLLHQHRPAMFPLVLLDGAFLSAGRLPRRKLDRALAARKAS